MRGEYTLSYHYFSQRNSLNHLELFLDTDGQSPLQTWQCYSRGASYSSASNTRRFTAAAPHRRVYLEFRGTLEGKRGRLRILRRGKFIDRRRRARKSIQVIL